VTEFPQNKFDNVVQFFCAYWCFSLVLLPARRIYFISAACIIT